MGGGRVVDRLVRLVEQSLVVARPHGSGTRYTMLEPIRAYAWGRLVESGDDDEVRAAHARYFVQLAEQADAGMRTADEPTWVGALPIGYGDGWRRSLSNNARVLVRGRSHPLVGTVSMDNVTIDLGPETDVRVGDPAILIGEQGGERILCEEVASRLATINYEVTCGLTQRVRRDYEAG